MNNIKIQGQFQGSLQDYRNDILRLCNVTRKAHLIDKNVDLANMKAADLSQEDFMSILNLPHGSIKRFTTFKFFITGASRRFLQQIRTHHVGIDFVSGSLQYSDWKNTTQQEPFLVPYELLSEDKISLKASYVQECNKMLLQYQAYRILGVSNDTCGYLLPESLRNILAIHCNLDIFTKICRERICNRNTDETLFIVGLMALMVSNALGIDQNFFMPRCIAENKCPEGKFSCKKVPPFSADNCLQDFLLFKFPYLEDQIIEAGTTIMKEPEIQIE